METNQSRRSRLSDYTSMANQTQNTQSAAPLDGSLARGLLGSQWGLDSTSTRNNNAITPRDPFNNLSTAGLDAPSATASTDRTPWGSTYWRTTNTRHTRAASGNTPPQSRAEASNHRGGSFADLFGPGSLSNVTSAGSRPATTTTSESANGAFRYQDGLRSYVDEGNGDQFAASQPDAGLSDIMGPRAGLQQLPRNLRNSVPDRQDMNLQKQTNGFSDDFTFGSLNTAAIHSQRASISGSSFATQPTLGLNQNLADAFGRMDIGGPSNGATNSTQNAMSYTDGSQSFQFNPVSQPWGNGQGYGTGFGNDPFTGVNRLEHRGSIAGRESPAGSGYRTGGALNSPKSFTGTPQPNGGPWSRPVSRDHRVAELNGGLGNPSLLQQHQSPFFQNGGYPQNYPQFQTPYNRYTAADFYPVPIAPAYGGPMPPFQLGIGGIPARPARDQDAGRAFRSPVLHEFKNSPKSRRWELQDIWGHIVEFSGDQQASRFIQAKLETANSDERNRVFAEIEPNAVQLMMDVFGNYVMQKLFEYGDQVQKRVLANAMKGRVVDLSTQPYGCRVVQKALEHVLVEQQVELVKELEADLLSVAKDQHGNHVIQQAIALVPREHLDAVMARFRGNVGELASHQYGCRVIQRILEHGSEDDKASMMQELQTAMSTLLTDMYGNYVIQHVLEKGSPEERTRIIGHVTPQLLLLSRHKNASNVVEKCILFGAQQQQRAIRDALLTAEADNNSPLFQLMRDQYGNYVIQKLVKALQPRDKTVLVDQLALHLPSLRRSGATAKQIEAMERLVTETRAAAPPPPSEDEQEDEKGDGPTPTSTAPPSPGLRVEVNSAAPTPNLTTNPNSPLSDESGSPPLPSGAALDSVAGRSNGQIGGKQTTPVAQPRVREA